MRRCCTTRLAAATLSPVTNQCLKLAYGNQKGGVGKSAVALTQAAAAAKAGHRVLVGDMDPQANTTAALGAEKSDDGTVAAMTGRGRPSIVTSKWSGVDVMVSSLNLARADMDGSHDVPFRLAEALDGTGVLDPYDVFIVDLPPSVGRLLVAGLTAVEDLVLVTDRTKDGLGGVENVIETYKLVKARMNPKLHLLGIAENRVRRTTEQQFRADELRGAYGDLVFTGALPERAALAEAHAASLSIFDHTGQPARELSTLTADLWAETERRARVRRAA